LETSQPAATRRGGTDTAIICRWEGKFNLLCLKSNAAQGEAFGYAREWRNKRNGKKKWGLVDWGVLRTALGRSRGGRVVLWWFT